MRFDLYFKMDLNDYINKQMSNKTNWQICEALRTDMFQSSFIYNFQVFLQTSQGIEFFKIKHEGKPKSTFQFNVAELSEKMKFKMPSNNFRIFFKKQGFVSQIQKKLAKDTTSKQISIKHKKFNSSTTLKKTREIWLQNIRRNFSKSNIKSFPTRLFSALSNGVNIQWNEEGNVIILTGSSQPIANLSTDQKYRAKTLGFKIERKAQHIEYSHQFLNRDSSMQLLCLQFRDVWIWIQQFDRVLSRQRLAQYNKQYNNRKKNQTGQHKKQQKQSQPDYNSEPSKYSKTITQIKKFLQAQFPQDDEEDNNILKRPIDEKAGIYQSGRIKQLYEEKKLTSKQRIQRLNATLKRKKERLELDKKKEEQVIPKKQEN